MGLLDSLKGLLGGKAPKTGNALIDALLPMLTKGGSLGGLTGLLDKFKSAGLGGKADSWVGNGANEGLSADEVTSALGTKTVSDIATKAGMSNGEAAGGLASILPGLINKLSPGGSLPTGNITKALKGLDFGSLLGGLTN